MKFKDESFIPMLFGGDINTYSVARAFYEQYSVRSYVFGKYASGPSYKSKIITYTPNPDIEKDKVFLETVNEFCKNHSDKKVILVGCGDSYAALISKHKDSLPENAVAPYTDFELINKLQQKAYFYELCEKHGIDYPDTIVYTQDMKDDFPMDFPYPVILKPSNPVRYWECPFDTQEKVYKIADRNELIKVIHDIYGAGYDDKLIIQDMIPGNDEYMNVLTSYSDKNGKVKMMCLGHVLLEEHTPHGSGNHAVIITESNKELMRKVKVLLEELGYIGFSNFDIKYDERDGKYKFFEINTRQGRSNFYVTGSGLNISKYIVEEYINGKSLRFESPAKPHLWLVVPKAVARKYVHIPKNQKMLNGLLRNKEYVNPVFMKGDNDPNRMLRMIKNHLSHFKKYKMYYK